MRGVMSLFTEYRAEIETRRNLGLSAKPIDDGKLIEEIIACITDPSNANRSDCLNFLIYNTLPGTTNAAAAKAAFLKRIIEGHAVIEEITPAFAFELLAHMKGGPSVEVLLDLALGLDKDISLLAVEILKSQVFLYEADTDRLKKHYKLIIM